MPPRQKSLKKNALLNIIRSVMGIIFPLITFPYVSRVLLPEGIGKVNFANSIISYFVMIAGIGIPIYGTREAAKYRDDKRKLSVFVKEIFHISIVTTLLAYLMLFASIMFIPKLQNYKVLLYITSANILFTTIGINWFYAAEEEYVYITVRAILFQVISLILLFTFVKTIDDYAIYAAIGVFSAVGSNLCNFIHSKKIINWKEKATFNYKKHFKPLFVFFGMSLVTSVYTMLDSSMLGFFTSDKQVGYYSAATKINKIILTLITALTSVLLPRLSYYAEKNENQKMFNLFNKAFSSVLFLSVPATAGLCILSRQITIVLSGENYIPAIPAMKIISPIICFISISNLIGIQLFATLKKEKLTFLSVALGAITNIICNIIFIPKFGVTGAAIGTLTAELFVTIFQLSFSIKYIDFRRQLKTITHIIVATIILVYAVRYTVSITNNSFLQLISGVGVGFISYTIMMIILKDTIIIDIIKTIKIKILARNQQSRSE